MIEGIITREQLADDYAYMQSMHWGKRKGNYEQIYDMCYKHVMRMNELDFINFWSFKYDQKLYIFSRNKYSLCKLI